MVNESAAGSAHRAAVLCTEQGEDSHSFVCAHGLLGSGIWHNYDVRQFFGAVLTKLQVQDFEVLEH